MALRCGCDAEGDEIVFGPRHACIKPLETPAHEEPREPRFTETLDADERSGN